MLITLLQETRGVNFTAFNRSYELPVLGQYKAEDFNAEPGFGFSGGTEAEVSTAQVKIRAPFDVAHSTLPLSRFPQMDSYYEHRARYASIQSTFYLKKTWLIEGGIIEQIGADMASVTLNLKDPAAWVAKYPSRSGTSGADLTGTRSQLLERLTASLSMSVPSDGEPFKKLPIIPFDSNWEPDPGEEAMGYVRGSTIDSGKVITVPSPDPLSITDALNEVMAEWPDGLGNYGLTLIEDLSYAAPMWRWAIWRHLPETTYITRADLELMSVEFSNEFTDAMVYNSDNPLEHRYMAGKTIQNPGHNGAWLGVDFQSYSKRDPRGTLPRPSRTPNVRREFNRGNRFPFTRNERGNRVIFTDDGIYGGDGQPVETSLTQGSIALIAYTSFGLKFTGQLPPEEPDFNIVLEVFVNGKKRGQIINSANPNGYVLELELPFTEVGHLVEIKPLGDKFVKGWACRFELPKDSDFMGDVISLPIESYRAPSGRTMSLEGQFEDNYRLWSVASPEGILLAMPDDEPGYAGISGYCERRFYGCTALSSAPDDSVFFPEYRGELDSRYKKWEYNQVALPYVPRWNNLPKVRSLAKEVGKNWFESRAEVQGGIPPFPTFEGVVRAGSRSFHRFITASGDLQHDESIRYIFPNLESVGGSFLDYFRSGVTDMTALYIPLLPNLREVRGESGESNSYFMRGWAAGVNPRPDGSFIDVIDDMPDWSRVPDFGYGFWEEFCRNNKAIDRTIKESKINIIQDYGRGPRIWGDGFMNNAYRDAGSIRTIFPEAQNLPYGTASNEMEEIYLNGYRESMYAGALAPDAPRDLSFVELFDVEDRNTSGFRNGCFADNGFDGTEGNSVNFKDGTPVLAKGVYKDFYKYHNYNVLPTTPEEETNDE